MARILLRLTSHRAYKRLVFEPTEAAIVREIFTIYVPRIILAKEIPAALPEIVAEYTALIKRAAKDLTDSRQVIAAREMATRLMPACPTWPAYAADRRATMIFNDECKLGDDPGGSERSALEALS